jgi:hypothetical protein
MQPKLGTIQYLKPRDIWSNEPKVFITWLHDDISEIADILGLDEIEITEQEGRVEFCC